MLKLVTYPDPILHEKCMKIQEFDDSLKKLAADMFELMYKSNGIGLAGPQVGVSQRIFVMDVNSKKRVVINPKINSNIGTNAIEEGCLSFPGIHVKVIRFGIINVEYQNEEGTLITENLSGLESICFQHELDHLSGITFIDALSEETKKFLKKRMERVKNVRRDT